MSAYTDSFTFLSGTELGDGTLLIVAQETAIFEANPHCAVIKRTADMEWGPLGLVGWVNSGTSQNEDASAVLAVDPNGEFLSATSEGIRWTDISRDADLNQQFRFIKSVAGTVYAGGTNRHVHQRIGPIEWKDISDPEMWDSEEAIGFESIAGFGQNELYAVGWDGEIWTNVGGWRKLDSPTNLILADATTHGEKVYACGQLGTIIRGRGDSWELVEHDITTDTLWSACSFGNAVYFAGEFGILKLEGGEVSVFRLLNANMRSAYSLFTGPSGLWSVGPTDICLFDGENWHTIAQS